MHLPASHPEGGHRLADLGGHLLGKAKTSLIDSAAPLDPNATSGPKGEAGDAEKSVSVERRKTGWPAAPRLRRINRWRNAVASFRAWRLLAHSVR
jgi:hypothetical protein